MIARKKAAEPKGLRCPKCQGCEWEVRKTRPARGGLRRIRVCVNPKCRQRIITYERAAFDEGEE